MIYKLIVIIIELEMNIGFNILNYKLTVMIQYFNKSSELGPLK